MHERIYTAYMLEQFLIFLAAAVLVVPIFKKYGFGTVLGYLTAGILIGPWVLRLVTDVDTILHFSEFGVVLLLFIIGLELQPSRLWVLRRSVFGLGSAQVIFSTIAIALLTRLFIQDWTACFVVGVSAALSSTAFILQTLAERGELPTRHGRDAFAILLFQDIAVIPLLAIIPLLGTTLGEVSGSEALLDIFQALAIIAILLVAGRTILRYLFRGVALFGNREIFTAAALFVVIGTASLMEHAGLSMSLGAFLAGMLLADSEFRHQIEAEIEPFKGLLLGLFFIAVGMSVNLGLVKEMPLELFGLALLLITTKFCIMFAISRFTGHSTKDARNLALTLPAGGEFAFVLFAAAGNANIFDVHTNQQLVVIITLSMLISPLLLMVNDKLSRLWAEKHVEPEYDRIDEPGNPVVIIGFGRFGQIISRILHMRDIHFTALDNDPKQVDFVRKFGNKIYYGDATRLDLLRAARIGEAKLVVLAISDIETSMTIANLLQTHYQAVPIYARAHNRLHCYKLMDLGIKVMVRDTYYSSLKMGKEVLESLGLPPDEADQTVVTFREHDEELLKRQHAIYKDEEKMIESVAKSRAELQSLFEEDISSSISSEKPDG